MKKITIFGAGAIGGVIGAHIAKTDMEVEFVDINEEHVKAMNEKGLSIVQGDKSFTVNVKAFTVDELVKRGEALDTVFLAVKALHTREAVRSFKGLLTEDSCVVSFQNGLCEYEIAEEIGKERTIGCFINLFADYLEPGVIEYGGVGSLFIGEIDGRISERVERLVSMLQVWGNAKATSNILGFLWSKLAYGAVLTATATTNETIADVLASPTYRQLVLNIATEVLTTANLKGIEPEPFDDWTPNAIVPFTSLETIDEKFQVLVERLRGYTKTRTGIWRDIAVRKRKTEVPEQLNPVIKEGEKLGLDMHLTKKIVKMIEEIETGTRQLQKENLDELLHEGQGDRFGVPVK